MFFNDTVLIKCLRPLIKCFSPQYGLRLLDATVDHFSSPYLSFKLCSDQKLFIPLP